MTFNYESVFGGISTIKFEVTHRNPLQLEPILRKIKHEFKDPFTDENIIETSMLNCMDITECMAEKIRACFTRKEPAIRDFFDIWYVSKFNDFNFDDKDYLKLVLFKINEEKEIKDISEYISVLNRQVKSELVPTLSKDYGFNLNDAIEIVLGIYENALTHALQAHIINITTA